MCVCVCMGVGPTESGSPKLAVRGDSPGVRWIEKMKKNIFNPFPGGRGNPLVNLIHFKISHWHHMMPATLRLGREKHDNNPDMSVKDLKS